MVVECKEEAVLNGRSDELTLLGAMEFCAPSEELRRALSDSYFYDEQFFGSVKSYVERPLKETTLELVRAPSMTPKLVRELLRLLRQSGGDSRATSVRHFHSDVRQQSRDSQHLRPDHNRLGDDDVGRCRRRSPCG